jgi:hypothetical protein
LARASGVVDSTAASVVVVDVELVVELGDARFRVARSVAGSLDE